MKETMINKPLRTVTLSHLCSAMNWVNSHVCYADLSKPIGPRDRVRWWLEGLFSRVFALVYQGSVEEIRDGIEFARDEVDDKYLTPLQVEIKRRLREWDDPQ